MKFGCEKCDAKYNIADEKVTGRTLRMGCRKCGAEIIIHGKELAATPAPEPSVPVAPSPVSEPPAPPSQPSIPSSSMPVGALLTPQVPVPSFSPEAGGEAVWHVSINDVPVGPITLEELTHKMESNAISEYSLVWRNDFDEWRPLATVPDLMSLLVHQRESVLPAGQPASLSGLAAVAHNPFGEESQPPPPLSSVPASAPPVSTPPASASPSSAPASAPPTNGHSTSAELASMTASISQAPPISQVPPMPPLGTTSTETPPSVEVHVAKPGPTMGAMVLVLGAMGASFAAGYFVKDYMTKPTASVVAPTPNIERKVELEFDLADEEVPPVAAKPTKEPPQQEIDAKPTKRAVKRIEPAEPAEERLTESEKRLIAKFGSSADAAPAKIKLDNPAPKRGSSKKPLDEDAVKRTVTKGQPGLKRCYERAIRGQALAPSVRIDVSLEVAPSGRVSKVTTKGSGPGGLTRCIEGQIQRWRFPASAGGEAGFPVVFSGG